MDECLDRYRDTGEGRREYIYTFNIQEHMNKCKWYYIMFLNKDLKLMVT